MQMLARASRIELGGIVDGGVDRLKFRRHGNHDIADVSRPGRDYLGFDIHQIQRLDFPRNVTKRHTEEIASEFDRWTRCRPLDWLPLSLKVEIIPWVGKERFREASANQHQGRSEYRRLNPLLLAHVCRGALSRPPVVAALSASAFRHL